MPVRAITTPANAQPPCRGFTLEVKVFIPKQGFRLHVIVDKTCVNNEPRWGLIFELEKKIDGEFVQIVMVSFKPKLDDPLPQQGIEKMVDTKITQKQLKIAKEELFPVAAELEGASGPNADQKKRLEAASRKIAVAEL